MKPCPCGYLGDDRGACHCSKDAVTSYRRRISGPLLDRIDMSVNVPRPPPSLLRPGARKSERTLRVRRRVQAAREIQLSRAGTCNAWLDGNAFERHCTTEDSALRLLEMFAEKHSLSVRAQRRVLRVARTIADLAKNDVTQEAHVAEALSLRNLG